MNDKSSSKSSMWLAAVVLVAAIALLLWLIFDQKDYTAIAQARLKERADQYVKLRMEDNWEDIYKMTDPAERKKISRRDFLGWFGTGAMRVRESAVRSIDFDPKKLEAMTTVYVKAELVPENLPVEYRGKVRVDDPSMLVQEGELPVKWVWKAGEESRPEGDWYFKMDSVLTQGRDSQGRSPMPVQRVPTPTDAQTSK